MSGALFSKRKLVAALAALGMCGLEALLCELAVLDGCCGGFMANTTLVVRVCADLL